MVQTTQDELFWPIFVNAAISVVVRGGGHWYLCVTLVVFNIRCHRGFLFGVVPSSIASKNVSN